MRTDKLTGTPTQGPDYDKTETNVELTDKIIVGQSLRVDRQQTDK